MAATARLDQSWTEKYRPKVLGEVIGQEVIVQKLESFVKTKNFPNMIFAGSAGIGKTTCAIAMAGELYGERLNEAFLELNASDSRGIDVVRTRIKEFAKTMPLTVGLVKIVFLDEADAMTSEAQHALRRTMEKYAGTTRFILSANYASKIIEPIQSRCVVLRFKPLRDEDMRGYVKRISKEEDLDVDDKAMEALIYVSDGDMRKLTNVLQSAATGDRKITDKQVYDIAARARPKEIMAMLRYALSGDFAKARNELNTLILNYGMSGEDILLQCYREALTLDVEDKLKLSLVSNIGDCNFRIVEGANDRIQIEAMLAKLALLSK
ncbi:MAG: replication factor C small subunit [Candidatus Micrarchaeota archaeon]|nr:replication factor C small subunit [Candidatus Micrarchaeota archaeon]MDE1850090.1 replication factor C small subunit [Candidatus Micrarchaeota archaeon]